MIISLKDILRLRGEKAIGAFNVTTFENCKAIIDAAIELNKPVILNYTSMHSKFLNIEDAANIMIFLAKKAPIPICVHLDHGKDLTEINKAIDLGFSSVMFDGSALPYTENIKFTKEIADFCHSKKISIEAELGHILVSENGIEDSSKQLEDAYSYSKNDTSIYTDPDKAKYFVTQTKVDALAIAFGTAHGLYLTKPELNIKRIKDIKNLTDTPLVMHGGSGLSNLQYKEIIAAGIAKVNYYTYMALAGGDAIYNYCKNSCENDKHYFHDLSLLGYETIKKHVKTKIELFS